MDLNEFVFRDDAVEALGAGTEVDDDPTTTGETFDSLTPAKIGLAAISSAALGLVLGHVTKSL
jgi:hypothetical protein